MSRSVSTLTLAVLLFFTFFAIFTSAAPTKAPCDKPEDVPAVPEDPPTVDNPTNTPNSTIVDDGTSDDSDVPTLDVNTLATSAATYSGRATWFDVGLGACGYVDDNSDFIVALAQPNWGGGSNCNRKLQITNPKNGRTKTATVRDLCPSCSSGSLDMSPSLFTALADNLGLGVFQMTWKYS